MPQTNEGILLVIGALFLLLGLLGGGFEISAIKVPPVGKFTRAFALAIGGLVFGAGLFRLLIPSQPAPIIVVPPTLIIPSAIALPATSTPAPPTHTPQPASPTPLPTSSPPPSSTPIPTSPPLPSPTATPTAPRVTAEIQDVSVTYDQTRFEQMGMVIHIKFLVSGLKDVTCRAVAYFEQRTGEPLVDKNGAFSTVDGNVSAGVNFTPGYDITQYDDLQIFMPYDEFELGPGTYELKFNVQLFDMRDTSNQLASSPDIDFDFNK